MNLNLLMTQPEENPGVTEKSCYQGYRYACPSNPSRHNRIQHCNKGAANSY